MSSLILVSSMPSASLPTLQTMATLQKGNIKIGLLQTTFFKPYKKTLHVWVHSNTPRRYRSYEMEELNNYDPFIITTINEEYVLFLGGFHLETDKRTMNIFVLDMKSMRLIMFNLLLIELIFQTYTFQRQRYSLS